MTYRAKIINGQVVFEGSIRPAEGSSVDVTERTINVVPDETVWDRLLKLAGTAKGLPPDASRNLDHYLYGAPKK